MPNSYFQFKQFVVHQDRAAMKVSTDSCLFGAWAGDRMVSYSKDKGVRNPDSKVKGLDIGSGTALLSLMLAQKTDFLLDAIEMEAGAFQDAEKNISISPWKERISLIHADVREYAFDGKYDVIISNPPFYEKSLKSAFNVKNQAMHEEGLVLSELMEVVSKLLNSEGLFAVMVPAFRGKELYDLAVSYGLSCREQLEVSHVEFGKTVRGFFLFSTHTSERRKDSMYIRNPDQTYSDEFIRLLQPYYLYL